MRRTIRRRLTVFFTLAIVMVGFTGLRYAQLADSVFETRYVVSAELPTSGGLFTGAEVTYRGVPVGRVTAVDLSEHGVTASLAIRNQWHIPDEVMAHVRNRSAVGEQYVDLVPSRTGPPYLQDGSHLDRTHTTTPLQEDQLIGTIDAFAQSVNTEDLRTVVTELGEGFHGSAGDIQALLDGTSDIITAAHEHLPETLSLLDNTTRVLQTQLDGASDIRSFARSLRDLTGTLRGEDGTLRAVLRYGPPAARELHGLVNQLAIVLPRLLSNVISIGQLTVPRLPGLAVALAILPYDVAAVQAIVRNGRSYLGLSLNGTPDVCQKGYISPGEWRSTNDLSEVPAPLGARCAEPGLNWRGSAHAP